MFSEKFGSTRLTWMRSLKTNWCHRQININYIYILFSLDHTIYYRVSYLSKPHFSIQSSSYSYMIYIHCLMRFSFFTYLYHSLQILFYDQDDVPMVKKDAFTGVRPGTFVSLALTKYIVSSM